MYTVEFTDEAIAELRKESKFSESKWGKKHARKYFSDFRKKLKGLGQNYRLYKTHDEILQGLRLFGYKGNKALFWVNEIEKKVVILGVPRVYRELSSESLKKRAQRHGYTEQ